MLKKTHTCSLQLRAIVGEMQTMHSVRLEGEWFKRLSDMKFGKRIAKRTDLSNGELFGPSIPNYMT